MTQLSNVPMQPNPNAVERPLTLIEQLEQKRDHHNHFLETCRNDRDKAYHSFGKKCYQEAINIVKQHSEWVPCSERMPNDGENVLFHSIHSRTVSLGCRNKYGREYLWDITDSCGYELDRNISHWQPLPQPPSEVQA